MRSSKGVRRCNKTATTPRGTRSRRRRRNTNWVKLTTHKCKCYVASHQCNTTNSITTNNDTSKTPTVPPSPPVVNMLGRRYHFWELTQWIAPRIMHFFRIYLHYISFALHLHYICISHSPRNRYICITFH